MQQAIEVYCVAQRTIVNILNVFKLRKKILWQTGCYLPFDFILVIFPKLPFACIQFLLSIFFPFLKGAYLLQNYK